MYKLGSIRPLAGLRDEADLRCEVKKITDTLLKKSYDCLAMSN